MLRVAVVELLVSTRFADAAQIYSVRTPGGSRTQLTFEANQDFQFYATVMFIRRHLLGEAPSSE